MTQAQVTEILGTPTAVESLNAFTTLFYRSGSLNGLVNFREDRVVAVNKPTFGE
jgi:outer membrane protein assembly factor BamE (lipoprotein component of BamABCDE complex)